MTHSKARDWFGGAATVMFVHAHPDDETIATGGTLAALAAEGLDPAVVTLTRGEQGEVRPGLFASLEGTRGLARHRETELASALSMLGVTRHAMLGTPPARAAGLPPRVYEDSGMAWGSDGFAVAGDSATGLALTRAHVVEPITDLLALAESWCVGAIVSYDERGGYGHPDHVFAHRIARAVAHGLEIPFWEIVSPGPDGAISAVRDGSDVEYDVSPWWERKIAALRAYQTQLEVVSDTELVHVGGQAMTLEPVERFRQRESPKL